MAVQPVLLYPDIRLKTVCAPVEEFKAAAAAIDDLVDTMDAGPPRTVGIAAPQIGILVRIAIVHCERNTKYPGGNGFLAMINPAIIERDGNQIFREGCLSIPDYTANIHRAERIVVSFQEPDGSVKTIAAEGFESVVIQHELDHLDGILFLDRVTDMATNLFRRQKK